MWEKSLPELPEVETICRGLRPFMEGKVIQSVTCYRQNLRNPFPPMLAQRLEQQLVRAISRRGKYIVVELNDYTWIMHLGMSGRIQRNLASEYIHQKHDHVVWQIGDVIFAFNDPRRFGDMDLIAKGATYASFKNMAPEPFAITADDFCKRLQRTSRPLKTALLDQAIIAGLGNIYVCEALWQSGLSPFKVSNSISLAQTKVLLKNIIAVLELAIIAGGSSLRDHRTVEGELGYFQYQFKVYDQKAKTCLTPNCSGTIKREVQSGRSTYFCGICQKS
jgi:formamidopyrimidine-DNA glycosylase